MDEKQTALLGHALFQQARVNLYVARTLLSIMKSAENIKSDDPAMVKLEELIEISELQSKASEAWADSVGLTGNPPSGQGEQQ